MISDADILKVLDRADLIDIVKTYVPEIQVKGTKAVCRCPFHAERTGSFHVDNNKGLWYCHGCHTGGNAIQFVQKIESCNFRTAVLKIADLFHIHIEDKEPEMTAEERERMVKRQTMMAINTAVSKFYSELLWGEEEGAQDAREYIKSRNWSIKYAQLIGMGYAPASYDILYKFAQKQMLNIDLMIEMGLLKKSDEGRVYDAYRDRLVIPIRSRSNQVIGFTARLLHEEKYKALKEKGKINYNVPKYINSQESECYNKKDSIFGIESAVKMGVEKGVFYLVEGGPDVMRLHSLDINNSIASLGGVWTDSQLSQLKQYNATLCFIPDCDPPKPGEIYGAGVKNVIENGKKAINLGFNVTVKEIIPDGDEKSDPDSFITSKAILDAIEEVDFVIWYAGKLRLTELTLAERSEKLEELSALVAKIPNTTIASALETNLGKKYGMKKEWRAAISRFRKEQKEESKLKRSSTIDRDLLSQYGFYADRNCYYSIGKEGADYQWSNFIMTPLFHIEDTIMPKRLYRIKNISGTEKLIELKQSELTSLARFSERVEGLGNYIWLAKQEQLNKLKMFLYEQTETATEITQLGWQQNGFWAYGNGVYYNGEWIEADDLGIVRLGGIGNYYLPACSMIYKGETKLFQFERQFIHTDYNKVTLRAYTDKMIEVFGTNAKVGICFLLATLFKDVVTGVTKNFPILNLFGQKGSGKSEMGHSLMSFFIINNAPPNLQNATDAALADAVAQSSNALVHLDEYKNTIDLTRREFLKGLYDGTGRSRMNMDRDKKREMTAVDCGVVVSGQEMPTIDNALFSRLIYLTFTTSEFSSAAKQRFNELTELRKLGCSHLTLEILNHRKKFEVEFPGNYRSTLTDIVSALERDSIDDRILRSWVIPLAAFRTLSGVLDLPFDYKDMLQVSIQGIVRQNSECRSNNELAQFWTAVEVMHQQGIALNGADFRINYETKISTRVNGKAAVQEWRERKPILYINYKVLLASYQKYARGQGDTIVPENTLRNYLEVSSEYLGLKTAFRFQMPNNHVEAHRPHRNTDGTVTLERVSKNCMAYCFDYTAVAEKYGINLEVANPTDNIDTNNFDNSNLPF